MVVALWRWRSDWFLLTNGKFWLETLRNWIKCELHMLDIITRLTSRQSQQDGDSPPPS